MGTRGLSRLVRAGAIREAEPGYYLDEASYSAYGARRHRNAIVIMAVLAVMAVIAVAAGLAIGLAGPR